MQGSILKLLAKQFAIELGEKAVVSALNSRVNYGLEKIKEFLAKNLQ